ncbi:hypothetical protein B0J14DRAFT_661221 [Halenospora varia]|nr:hypothetical protein B0J14DRAFT_661221 [Halenospora varia]
MDPASNHTWGNNGAAVYPSKFLQDHGKLNWVNAMNRLTTADGSQPSNLDCVSAIEYCHSPVQQCVIFTSPEVFHV